MIGWIPAEWPAPATIIAGTTTRDGGVSKGSFASLNVGHHTGDEYDEVYVNRRRLSQSLKLAKPPVWLDQVHGSDVHQPDRDAGERLQADASVTTTLGLPLVIMTADCLPVLLCNRDGTEIGAAHGGWRSLVGGILANTIEAMTSPPGDLVAWLGPAISQPNFEVGAEVREACVEVDAELDTCFQENNRGRFQADLYAIARQRLRAAGVTDVHGGGYCTYADDTRFFSYRREPGCGRMATVIQLPPQ